MATHTHKIRKTAKANTEKLPDITGENITYAGSVECGVELTQRTNAEPTVVAGSEATIEGYTGTIEQQQAEILPQYKEDGLIVWELTTQLSTEGSSV